jgi:diguanylate cyclase (GGDEF)-like protein/PAS domain S-box-containing protein
MHDNYIHSDLKSKSLQTRISVLEEVIKQINNEKNNSELLDFPWVGNLGQWYWMVPSNQVVFNEKKVTNLGYKISELPKDIGFDFFTEKLHPHDYQRVMDNMRSHLMGVSDSYEVEYRILAANGDYIWYYDRGKVTKRDENGKALVVSGIVFDINKNKQIERQLEEANKKLEKMVITDALTGAYNRRYTLKCLENEINRARETNIHLSLIMLDIDNFKRVNDNFGHDVGDSVLKNIVQIINSKIKNREPLCRWGGEEFIIILPETDNNKAVEFAEMIRKELCDNPFDGVGKVTASFGVTSFIDGDNTNSIIKKADIFMYKSKEDGKNRVSY